MKHNTDAEKYHYFSVRASYNTIFTDIDDAFSFKLFKFSAFYGWNFTISSKFAIIKVYESKVYHHHPSLMIEDGKVVKRKLRCSDSNLMYNSEEKVHIKLILFESEKTEEKMML